MPTSAPDEKIFSLMNNMWSDQYRNRILEQNMKTLITCKSNTNFSYCDFYEKIKWNKKF